MLCIKFGVENDEAITWYEIKKTVLMTGKMFRYLYQPKSLKCNTAP